MMVIVGCSNNISFQVLGFASFSFLFCLSLSCLIVLHSSTMYDLASVQVFVPVLNGKSTYFPLQLPVAQF
jgi:hypothetical protein